MVYNSTCINSKVDAFLSATSEMIDIVFPLKTFRVHEDDKLFISGKIKQMISKRDKLFSGKELTILNHCVIKSFRKFERKNINYITKRLNLPMSKIRKHGEKTLKNSWEETTRLYSH